MIVPGATPFGTGYVPPQPEPDDEQAEKLQPELELCIGKRPTGFAVVQDAQWPAMYRVRSPSGELSDMVNLSRAKDAAVRLARPRGLGGSEIAHWDIRETALAAPAIAPNDCPLPQPEKKGA